MMGLSLRPGVCVGRKPPLCIGEGSDFVPLSRLLPVPLTSVASMVLLAFSNERSEELTDGMVCFVGEEHRLSSVCGEERSGQADDSLFRRATEGGRAGKW